MAAKGGNRGENGETQIRFIMLEARGNAADLQQIAQAITSAVRPTTVIQQIAAPPAMPAALPANGQQPGIVAEPDLHPSVEIVDEAVTTPPSTRKGPAKKKKLRMPEVLNELDLTSGPVPFVQYFNEKNPDDDHSKRYLVIAAWLKEYRQLDEINSDHIYTCYRKLNMNVVADVGSIFRGCKRQGWFQAGSKPGWFAINHIGLGQVNSMGNGG